jgi:hypothetical protein
MKPPLTVDILRKEAQAFALKESAYPEPSLYGTTDGKAVGTYLEHKFRAHLSLICEYSAGDSAKGIDFPSLGVDIKVTSVDQPQSSSPFNSARQKIFGLGYGLLIFVYEKQDDPTTQTATLNILHVIFVEKEQTADFQMTTGIAEILARKNNRGVLDDLVAFMQDKNLPVDEIEVRKIAKDIVKKPPALGYLTISNALQWRLQYTRVIAEAGKIAGIVRVK